MSVSPHTSPDKTAAGTPLLAYLVAAFICLVTASALGYGGWVVFTRRPAAPSDKPQTAPGAVVQHTPAVKTGTEPLTPSSPTSASDQPIPSGLVSIPGGEVLLGGEGTNEPVQKAYVEPFYISETEVTNAQYRVFVGETAHKAAAGWKGGEFPAGTAQEPVTGVTWQDASDYCSWLGQKGGATGRLPMEYEWTRAARGDQNYKYPWGVEWKDGAAAIREGHVRAVKSYPTGASPFGVYDMAGNVWEWVADEGESRVQDSETGQTEVFKGKVIKGGAAFEKKSDNISALARSVWPPDKQNGWLGFRCAVTRAQ
jgi:formylglycine-generating enzyme required for sulfatase activity